MTVKKTTRECYEIRVGERGRSGSTWANIILNVWGPSGQHGYYGGEIQINSDYGNWANIWTACGSPFKKFLLEVNFDYLFTKFMGSSLDRFDASASYREVRAWVTSHRREHVLSKSEAKDAWELCEACLDRTMNEHEFGGSMQNIASDLGDKHPLHDHFADPMAWPRCTKYDSQAEGFWKELWPSFAEALKAELAAEAERKRQHAFDTLPDDFEMG